MARPGVSVIIKRFFRVESGSAPSLLEPRVPSETGIMQLGTFTEGPLWPPRRLSAELSEWSRRWRKDLLECLPALVRRRLGRLEQRLELALSGDGNRADLRLVRGAESELLVTFGHPDPDAIRRAVARAEAPVVLVVSETDVLRRRATFPVQVKDSLARVLGYELDRLTPFAAQEVFFDHRVLPTRLPGQLEVELALVKRARAERWITALSGAAAAPRALTWPGAWPGANLLPPALRGRRERGARFLIGSLWLTTALLVVAVLTTPLLQKRDIVLRLGERLSDARFKADKVLSLRQRLDKEAASANLVVERKRGSFLVIELLRRLTESIPDDSWVSQMSVHDGRVELRGESRAATALIQTLSQDPAFRNAAFKSPVVGIRNTDRERFHIEFDLVAPEASR
jgi:general secretion pathway protein L